MVARFNTTTQLTAALDYQARGWAVIPVWPVKECKSSLCTAERYCSDAGKHARVKWKNLKTPSEGQIVGWWRDWPQANIGILTGWRSGLDVIDIDPKNGGSYEALKAKFPDMPEPHVRTGSGGFHIYIQYPLTPEDYGKGVRTSNSLNKVFGLPGIDYRGDGGYVIAPPSDHTSDNWYEWISDEPTGELPMLRDAAVRKWEEKERKPKKKAKTAAKKKTVTKTAVKPTGRDTDYGLSKLDIAQMKLRNAAVDETGRHDELLRMAHLLGGCVPKNLTEVTAFDGLRKTALEVMGEEREDEIERTINDGLDAGMDEPLEEEETDAPEQGFVWADTITMVRTRWLWQQRIPLGAVSTIAGDGDRGKSTLALLLAAKVTKGELRGDLYGKPRSVLISTTEDTAADTLTPRLRAAGADLSKVAILRRTNSLLFPQDADRLVTMIGQTNAGLLVLEPFLGHFGANDSHKESDVRQAMNPLVEIAEEHKLAVVGLHHFNKGNGSATQRLSGSSAWRNVARAVLICEEAPESVTEGTHVLAVEKANLSEGKPKSIAYVIRKEVVGQDDGDITAGVVQLRAEVDITAAGLLNPQKGRKRDSAKDWLQGALELGPVPVSDLKQRGVGLGHSEMTIDRVRAELGVKATRHTNHSDWSLPGTDLVCDDADPSGTTFGPPRIVARRRIGTGDSPSSRKDN